MLSCDLHVSLSKTWTSPKESVHICLVGVLFSLVYPLLCCYWRAHSTVWFCAGRQWRGWILQSVTGDARQSGGKWERSEMDRQEMNSQWERKKNFFWFMPCLIDKGGKNSTRSSLPSHFLVAYVGWVRIAFIHNTSFT